MKTWESTIILFLLAFQIVPVFMHKCVHEEVSQHFDNLPARLLRYERHPFEPLHKKWSLMKQVTSEFSSFDNGGHFVSRKLLESGYPKDVSGYEGIRVKYEVVENDAVDNRTMYWIRNHLIQEAVSWVNRMLEVYPVEGSLFFSSENLASCGRNGTTGNTEGVTYDMDFFLVVGTKQNGPCQGGETQNAGCAAAVCHSASETCSQSHDLCATNTGGCTTEDECAFAELACQQSIQVCLLASMDCQVALSTCAFNNDAIAYGSSCQRDQYDRPLLGHINLCPAMLPDPAQAAVWSLQQDQGGSFPAAGREILMVVLHEICHALGFTAGSLQLFRDAESGGAPRTPRENGAFTGPVDKTAAGTPYHVHENTVQVSEERGHSRCDPSVDAASCVYHLVTPAVRAAARRHFNCPSLKGMELENQPGNAGSMFGSHWEMRLLNGEVMSSMLMLTPYVSQLTLAFFHDSGWYHVPEIESKADTFDDQGHFWGWQQGCEFAQETCLRGIEEVGQLPQSTGDPPHFCNQADQMGCSFDRKSLGKCMMKSLETSPLSGQVNYPEYAYFTGTDTPYAAGAVDMADFCPFFVPTKSCQDIEDSRISNGNRSSDVGGQSYGTESICLVSSLSSEEGLFGATGACYKTQCIPEERILKIAVASDSGEVIAVCDHKEAGVDKSVPGFQGLLVCPDVDKVCGTSGFCDGFKYTVMTWVVWLASLVVGVGYLLYVLGILLARAWELGPNPRNHWAVLRWCWQHFRSSVPGGLHPISVLTLSCHYHLSHSYILSCLSPRIGSLQSGDIVRVALHSKVNKKAEAWVQLRLVRPKGGVSGGNGGSGSGGVGDVECVVVLPVGGAPLAPSLRSLDHRANNVHAYLMRVNRTPASPNSVRLTLDGSSLFMLSLDQKSGRQSGPYQELRDTRPAAGGDAFREGPSAGVDPNIDLSQLDAQVELGVQWRLVDETGRTPAACTFQDMREWRDDFPESLLVVPPLRALNADLRPRGSGALSGAGRCHRRLIMFLLIQAGVMFFLTAYETSVEQAEQNMFCNSLAKQVWMRSFAAAVVCTGFQYFLAVLRSKIKVIDFSVELMPSRMFAVMLVCSTLMLIGVDSSALFIAYHAKSLNHIVVIWGWSLLMELVVIWPIVLFMSGMFVLDLMNDSNRQDFEVFLQSLAAEMGGTNSYATYGDETAAEMTNMGSSIPAQGDIDNDHVISDASNQL